MTFLGGAAVAIYMAVFFLFYIFVTVFTGDANGMYSWWASLTLNLVTVAVAVIAVALAIAVLTGRLWGAIGMVVTALCFAIIQVIRIVNGSDPVSVLTPVGYVAVAVAFLLIPSSLAWYDAKQAARRSPRP